MLRSIRILLSLALVCVSSMALAADTDPPGLDMPRGVIKGKLVREDTADPIGRMWLTLSAPDRRYSRSASTDTFGRFEFVHIPKGDGYRLTFFNDGYATREYGPFSVKDESTPVTLDWKAKPVPPQAVPYTYSDTFLPGENITVMVRSIRVVAVDVDVYRVPAAEVKEKLSGFTDRKRLKLEKGWKPVLTYRQPVAAKGDLIWRQSKVEPAFQDPGLYVIRVRAGTTEKLIPVVVTNLALVTKRTPDAVWVWAANLKTGAPVAGVEVGCEPADPTGKALSPKPEACASGTTDKSGLVKFAGSGKGNLRYWGFSGESMGYVDTVPSAAAKSLEFRTYVYTDRPAYRPGDELSFKVVARSSEAGSYRVVPNEEWTVTIKDPEDEVVSTKTYTTGAFGTFNGAFVLPPEPALGTWSITAESDGRVQSGFFKVLAYRKPDFKLDLSTPRPQVVQGNPVQVDVSGQYYFGAPLRGAKATYTVYETQFRPWWYDTYWGEYEGEGAETYGYGSVVQNGTVTLDDAGRARISVEVERASVDRNVTVEVVIADATGREVSARQKVLVTRGTFSLGVVSDGRIYKVGETATFTVDTARFDGAPSSRPVTLTASLETWDAAHKIWIYKDLATQSVTTDVKGKATWKYKVPRDGFIRVEAAAEDELKNPIVQSSFFWATKAAVVSGGYKKKSIDIVADRGGYKSGDTARVLVNTTRESPWVLFTVEGDGVFEARVEKVTGNSRMVEVKLGPKHAPNVYLGVAYVGDKQFGSLQRSIEVSPKEKILKIGLASDKAVYEPGQKAKYTVTVTDPAGKPAEAEVSLALVDQAIYAISPELAPDMARFFYGTRPNPTTTSHSFPQRYLGGADKDTEDKSSKPRRDFKDTAFWHAAVVTDATGKAVVEIPLPDNLTTWRLTVRGVTKSTLVGTATHEIKTSKNLMATIALPRFVRHGDRIEVVGMIHNRSEDLPAVTATLSVKGEATIDGAATITIPIKSNTSHAHRWAVQIKGGASAVFTISAAGGKFKDAEERTITASPVMVERIAGASGSFTASGQATVTVPEAVPGTARLGVRLAPSLAAAVVESLEDLATFPYGCVEQTMSSFIPDVVASKALQALKGLPRTGKLRALDQMVKRGLDRIEDLRRDDGAFGWWEGDAPNGYLTAYVLYGLGKARGAGFTVSDDALTRTHDALVSLRKSTGDWTARAFMALAIAQLPKTFKDPLANLPAELTAIRAHVADLDPYGLAVAILAHAGVGRLSEAAPLVEALRKRAELVGDLASFPGSLSRYSWSDNTHETTAYAARALLAADPKDSLAQKAIAWLLARRKGGFWDTTKDTAAAVEAIVSFAQSTGELEGRYRATVTLNGAPAGDLEAKGALLWKDLPIPADKVRGGENLLAVTFDPGSKGSLYWSAKVRYGATPVERKEGLTVSRTLRRVVTERVGTEFKTRLEPVEQRGLAIGDVVDVRIDVEAPTSMDYLIVEDPLPSGFEVSTQDRGGAVRREVRDNRVAFFQTRIGKGRTSFTYQMRAEMAGTVTAAPTAAWLMYLPQVFGNGAPDTLQTAVPTGK